MPRYFTQSCKAIIELSKLIFVLQKLLVFFRGIIKDGDFLGFTVILFAWVHLCTFTRGGVLEDTF